MGKNGDKSAHDSRVDGYPYSLTFPPVVHDKLFDIMALRRVFSQRRILCLLIEEAHVREIAKVSK